MCTVSYLPLGPASVGGKAGGYILTSNRDEAPQRNAIDIRNQHDQGLSLLYPVDPHAGGTWFCICSNGRAAALLNGAFEPFVPDPKFVHSRGIVLLDLMKYNRIDGFVEHYDLSLTAPFTIILAESSDLHQLIWDGGKLDWTVLDPGVPAFWSSVTLYPENVREWRKALFGHWIVEHPAFEQHRIIDFHRYGSGDDIWNGFVMNREERVKTLSISSVRKQDDMFSLVHTDLTTGKAFQETMDLSTLHVAKA
jgi:hypothetical protein